MKRTFYSFLIAAFCGCFALGLLAPPAEALDLRDWGKQFSNARGRFQVLPLFNNEAVLDMETQREAAERSGARRAQVGTGERSEKIRTYNFPQARLTDHRAGITLHKLQAIIEGDLDSLLDAVHGKLAADDLEAGDA